MGGKSDRNREAQTPDAGDGGGKQSYGCLGCLGACVCVPMLATCLFYPALLLTALPAGLLYWFVRKKYSRLDATVAALMLLFFLPNLRFLTTPVIFAFKAHTTLQEITETVEEPESLFIQNDVRDDKFMDHSYDDNNPYYWNYRWESIDDYLDGGLLKALAMQAPDGVVHLYRPGAEPFFAASDRCDREWRAMSDFAERLDNEAHALAKEGRDDPTLRERVSEARKQSREKGSRCYEVHKADIGAAYNSAELFEDVAELPPLRYRVHIWQKDRRVLFWRLYRVRQLDIYDNQNGRRIAWARAYYQDTPWLEDVGHAFNNALSWYPGVQCKFKRGPRERLLLRDFAEKVLFEETKRRKQAEQAAGETAAPDALPPQSPQPMPRPR